MNGNDVAKSLGLPIISPIGGKDWRISLPTKGIQGEFSVYMKARAREAMQDAMEGQPPEVIAASIKMLQEDFLSPDQPRINPATGQLQPTGLRKFDFGSAACNEALETQAHAQVYFFWLLLKRYQPTVTTDDVTEMIVEHPHDFQAAMQAVIEAGKSNPQALLAN